EARYVCFFFQAEDGIRARYVTGVQTCALPICRPERVGAGAVDRRVGEDAGQPLQRLESFAAQPDPAGGPAPQVTLTLGGRHGGERFGNPGEREVRETILEHAEQRAQLRPVGGARQPPDRFSETLREPDALAPRYERVGERAERGVEGGHLPVLAMSVASPTRAICDEPSVPR